MLFRRRGTLHSPGAGAYGEPTSTARARSPAPSGLPSAPLRLCLIAETMMTGVGRHVADIVEAMAARGHEIHLLHSTTRVDERLLARLKRLAGVHLRAFAMRREPHWSDGPTLLALFRHVRTRGPFDVIHGHSSKAGVYARLIGLGLPGRCLYTPHCFATMSPHLSTWRRTAFGLTERALALSTDRVICLSAAEKEHALGLGIGEDRVVVVPNGIDGRTLRGRRQLGLDLPDDRVIIGFVGRLDTQKAPHLLIEAVAGLLGGGFDIHLVVVGDGPLSAELAARTRRLGIAERVSWCGQVPSAAWIPTFDVLAIPSVYEGFSYVLLEAMQAGVPAVCTPVGGVAEAVRDGINGYVVPHDDVDALAARLGLLAGDPERRREMGRRARESAMRFTLAAMVDRLEEVYRQTPAVAGDIAPKRAQAGV